MIGCYNERSPIGQPLHTCRPQLEQRSEKEPIEAEEDGSQKRLKGIRWPEPSLSIPRNHFRWFRAAGCARLLGCEGFIDQVSKRFDPGDFLLREPDAKLFFELNRQRHPFERVEPQVELWICLQIQCVIGITHFQERPDIASGRHGEKRFVRPRYLNFFGPFVASQCAFINLR